MKAEECWFIRGFKVGSYYFGKLEWHSKGSAASVDFDWEDAMRGNVLGFYHTHPGGFSTPSTRDDRTMTAWVTAEGRPLLCGIFTGRSEKSQRCYLYTKGGGCREIRAKVVGNVFLGSYQ